MTNRLHWIGALAALAGVGVLVWAFAPPGAPDRRKARLEPDKTYRTVDGEALKLDLAAPAGDGPFPAVVCLHGGGWTGGDRKQMTKTLEVLARRGFVAIAPDYRLAPQHRFPACLEDCKAAVAWLRANAVACRVDGGRIGVMGLSAGGHLAMLTALTATPDERVQAVVSFSTPLDLADKAMWTPEVLKRNLVPLMGGPPQSMLAAYEKASPLRCRPNPLTPVFLVHGSEDKVVPLAQAQAFRERLGKAGVSVHLMVLQGEGHAWDKHNLLRSIDQMLTFLDETLMP